MGAPPALAAISSAVKKLMIVTILLALGCSDTPAAPNGGDGGTGGGTGGAGGDDEPPGQPAPPGDAEQRRKRIRELGTDVEIETLPDLDVIILRGRQRDVEELSRIIEEIERISAETVPVIDVYQLRHVGGEALSAIVAQINEDLLGGRQGRVSVTPLVKLVAAKKLIPVFGTVPS